MVNFKKVEERKINVRTDLGQNLVQGLSEETTLKPEEKIKTLGEALKDLRKENSVGFAYSPSADQELYISRGLPVDKDSLRALRNSNRNRAVIAEEEINRIRDAFKKEAEASISPITYIATDELEVDRVVVGLWGPAASGTITLIQYMSLKEIQVDLMKKENSRLLNRKKETAFNFEGPSIKEKAVSDEGTLEFPSSIGIMEVGATIDFFEREKSKVGEEGIPVPDTLFYGYDSVLEARELSNVVNATLTRVDENTTYIDALFNLPVDSRIPVSAGKRPQKYTLAEIWDNCFDCFAKAWDPTSGPLLDFHVSLDIELRVKELLDTLELLIDGLKKILNIKAMALANICSLARLGVLCPIELAFLIASIVATIRVLALEVAGGMKGFLTSLILGLLSPLLSSIEGMATFTVAPFKIYIGCVQKTLLSNSQVAWTGAFTRAQMAEILSGKRNSPLLRDVPEPTIQEFMKRVRSGDFSGELLGRILLQPQSFDSNEILEWAGLADVMDLSEYVGMITNFAGDRLSQDLLWIKEGLSALRLHSAQNTHNKLKIVATITLCSTVLSILFAMWELINGGTQICEKRPGKGGDIVVPRFTPEELINLIGKIPNTELFEGSIMEGEINPSGRTGTGYILNPSTGSKFSLVNCSKGKTSTISRMELASLMKDLGI